MTDRNSEIDAILARRITRPGPEKVPGDELVPVPHHLLGQQTQSQPHASADMSELLPFLATFFGTSNMQPAQTQERTQLGSSHSAIPGQLGRAPEATQPEPNPTLRARVAEHIKKSRLLRATGKLAIAGAVIASTSVATQMATGESIPQLVAGVFNNPKATLGLGNTYNFIMNSGDCSTPLASVEIQSTANLSVIANKATNPADVEKGKKDKKFTVPTSLVELTPLPIKGDPIGDALAGKTGDTTKIVTQERMPKIGFQDTLIAQACGEGGVTISGLNAEVDPSKIGFRLVSASTLAQSYPGIKANPNRVNLYESIAILKKPEGVPAIFTDAEINANNKLLGSGTNPSVLNAFRQNVTLPNIEKQCGAVLQSIAKPAIEQSLQSQFNKQVAAMKDQNTKKLLEGKKLTVSWKDGEAFKSLAQEYIESQDGTSYAVPNRISFQNPATTCDVTSLEIK